MKHAFSSMKRIGRYIKPYRLTFYLVILFTILTVAFNAALPYLTDYQRQKLAVILRPVNQSTLIM